MTRKDFNLIAQVFQNSKPTHIETDSNLWAHRQWIKMLFNICDELKTTNTQFDSERFKKACGLQDTNN